jgi:hypothetical protein
MAIDTTDPRADYPEDQMYVNQGPDRRLGGPIGKQLALIQRLNSFKSAEPPLVSVETIDGGVLHEVQLWPGGQRHEAWAFPRPNGRWDTYRAGHRWDKHWGDSNTKGFNPQPEIIGGAIYDVVIKRNQKTPHIDAATTADGPIH